MTETVPTNELLAQLGKLLEEDDFSVVTWWHDHATQFKRTLGDAAPAIEAAINHYDFSAALEAVQAWQQNTTPANATVDRP